MTNHEDINWGNTSTHGVNNKDLRLVRTSPHIDRWASDGSGSLIITPREDSSTYSRSTTHFTLNSIVQDHSSGTFSNGKYAVIGSLEDAAPRNTISGIGTVDTWMHPKDGKITLPNATLFAPEGEKLPERFDGLNVVRYAPDSDQAKNYSNLTSTIKSELSKNNIPTFEADSYGWHGIGMPSKEEVTNLSKLVGSDKKLPTIHFGSPDEVMESALSDVLKLKKYTLEDNFEVGGQSPMQQIDELDWRINKLAEDVHPDVRDVYKETASRYIGDTRKEVDTWKEKKFPPEPVNILPEGFPQPLGNSTSKPPPLPSSTQVPLIPSAMVPGMPPVPGASIPPPIPTNMPIDTPLDMIGESSEWTPRRFSEGLTPHESKALLEVYDTQGGKSATSALNTVYKKNPVTPVSNPVSIKEQLGIPPTVVTDVGISNNATSGIDSSKSAKQVHVETHDKLQTNSLKDFFGGNNLLSFDTETTNLDNTNEVHAKRGRIWQLGLATNGGIDGLEEHINPFFSTTADGDLVQSGKVSDIYLRDMLKHSNGQFSMKSYEAGNFNTFIQQYNKGELSSLDNAISKTLGSIDHNSVIVLQNMNFENSVLKSSVEQGILSEDIYKNIAGRMRTVGTDSIGNVTQLFQRPHSVVSKVREADMIFHTSYLTSKDPKDFTEYKNLLNEAVDSYAHTINDPKRSGVVAVELQDVTKAFLANAAEAGMIDKRTATLGLNIEFLAKTVLNEPEAHTALSDSRQTISLLQNLWGMTDELRTGTVSERTEGILSTIRQNQGVEVNKRFISSVRSVLSDFKQNGSTNIESSSNWYQPRAILREYDNEGKPNKLVIDKVSSSGTHKKTTSLPDALTTVLKRYSEYSDNLYNFNRSDYVSKIVKEHTEGANVAQLHTRVESDFFKIRPPAVLNTTENYLTDALSKTVQSTDYWKESVDFLGKSVTRKTRATVLGVAGAGLAVMAFQDRPEPTTKNYDNVSENFYDDQYLGTAFVDFRERNKHYMM